MSPTKRSNRRARSLQERAPSKRQPFANRPRPSAVVALKWIPPKEKLTKAKVLAALSKPAIEYPKQQNGRWHYPILRIASSNLSAKAALEGGYAGVFGKITTDQYYHLIEFSSCIPFLGRTPDGADAIFGRQVLGGVTTSDSSGSLSYAIANATLKAKTNTLNLETIGLADNATVDIRKLAGQTLSADSVRPFGEGVGQSLTWVVANASATGDFARPGPLFSVASSPDILGSLCFALGQIAEGNSLDQASAVLGRFHILPTTRAKYAAIDRVLVAAVYHRLNVTSTPNAGHVTLAENILNGSGALPPANTKQKGFYKPVLPYVNRDGAIASLAHIAPASRIQATEWPPNSADLSQANTKIGNNSLDLQGALDIGLGTLADLHASADMRFCGYLSWSTYTRPGATDSIVLEETYAAGIRVSARYFGSEITGGATALAAKVTAEGKAASFSIDILGVDVERIPSIATFAGGAATAFDTETVALIGGIWSEVNAVITSHDSADPKVDPAIKAAWKPCLTGVKLDLGAPELQTLAGRAAAVAYALNMVSSGTSRSQALAKVPQAYRDELVQIYDSMGIQEKPVSAQRNEAAELLDIGR